MRQARKDAFRAYRDRVRDASDDELAALEGARARLLAEGLLRLAPLAFDARRARGREATIEFRLKQGPGGASIHTIHVAGGRCRTRAGVVAEPGLTVEMELADFLRMTAGLTDGFTLLTLGRLRLGGDVTLALAVPRWFRL